MEQNFQVRDVFNERVWINCADLAAPGTDLTARVQACRQLREIIELQRTLQP
jgi:hypothetical protein